ncbi:MAG: hypothetical protein KAS32_00990 [Candidatus Peribacteraceae bacterium]|nr:hypothetical protein [Candidatus Peribacteraceae bacterium]
MADFESDKDIEYIILLLLGSSKKEKLSHLHIQKEIFILKMNSSLFDHLVRFIKHYRGPFSYDISEALKQPIYLEDAWEFIPPYSKDKVTGGYIEITEHGKTLYSKMIKIIKYNNDKKLLQVYAAINMIHDIYDDMGPKELLYYVYTNDKYSDWIKESLIYDEIVTKTNKEIFYKKNVRHLVEVD